MLAGLGRSGRPTSKMEQPEKEPVPWPDKKISIKAPKVLTYTHISTLGMLKYGSKGEEYFIHNEFRGWVVILGASFHERFPLLSKD